MRFGNSAAIAISKKDLLENNLRFNQRVKFAVLKNKKMALKKLLGLAPNTTEFVREEEDREF